MTGQSPAFRTLASEMRAVESGRHARLSHDGRCFLVKGEDHPENTYRVTVSAVGETVVWGCDHNVVLGFGDSPDRSYVPCRHASVVARSLERRGFLKWVEGRWTPTEKAYSFGVTTPISDPFDGLPS